MDPPSRTCQCHRLVRPGPRLQQVESPEAITAYRDAAEVDPDYLPAWHNLDLTFLALKGVDGVTLALQKLSASDPVAEAWRKRIIEYSLSRDERVAQKAIAVLRGLDVDKRRRMFEILFASV
jgi:hypothetical protein